MTNILTKLTIVLWAVAWALAASAETRPESDYNPFEGPWIFSGYREIPVLEFKIPEPKLTLENWRYSSPKKVYESESELRAAMLAKAAESIETLKQTEPEFAESFALMDSEDQQAMLEMIAANMTEDYIAELQAAAEEEQKTERLRSELKILNPNWVPDWLREAITKDKTTQDIMYSIMIAAPNTIDYAYWNLPVPPTLPEDDLSYAAFLRDMGLPDITAGDKKVATAGLCRVHWLHNAMAGVQFSQAYVSANWYQGGNDYLALLLNALWDVQLNTVYHPDVMFQSTVSYKLGINSTPPDSYHKYSISEDLFQWNLKTGIKAFQDFFWSYNLLFKTQLLRNYESNSDTRLASFLSPGELNMGLGMTYNYANKYKTLKVGVSLSPLSYNLKTCIDSKIDETRFNIAPGHKCHSEIGTNAEVTLEWAVTSDISCRSRFFAFTDYKYFQSDLETTWNFAINRFLSTQIYAHLRYDGSSELTGSRWKHWMLKEILSFGLTYTFSTKP